MKVELLYAARDGAAFDRLGELLGALRQRGIKLPDLLVAAAAQDGSVGVLHDDAHSTGSRRCSSSRAAGSRRLAHSERAVSLTVYSDTMWCTTPRMGRTQVYLTAGELELLDREAQQTGASRSALIRRAVTATYGKPGTRPPLTFVGSVSDGTIDSDRIDEELAEIFEERYRRWA